VRSCTAIGKEAGIFCGAFRRKREVFAYVGLIQNLKDLKDLESWSVCERVPDGHNSSTPSGDHPSDARRERSSSGYWYFSKICAKMTTQMLQDLCEGIFRPV